MFNPLKLSHVAVAASEFLIVDSDHNENEDIGIMYGH